MKRWLLRVLVFLVVTILALVIAGWVASEPRPNATPSPEADALAHRIEAAVNKSAWDRTAVVWWNFGDRYGHLWDRTRNFSRVRWGDVEVLLDLTTKKGVATKGGKKVEGSEADELLEKAYARWVNDSFWFNPLVKLFDDGTSRAIVKLDDGSDGLLITYGSGGVTPGDAYLWILGNDDLPKAWKMWVGILPIGGLKVTWEKWTALQSGARVATLHKGLIDFQMTGVQSALSVTAVERDDPFAPLFAAPSSQPAEQPVNPG